MALVEVGEYKGSKVLIIKANENDKYPFTFGLKKARLILEHVQEIRQFVEEESN